MTLNSNFQPTKPGLPDNRSPLVRDQAIAWLLFDIGLRLSECATLNVDDVRVSAREGLVVVRSGGGDTY